MKTVRVVLAEDNAFLREGLRALLESDGSLDIVGVVASLPELLECIDLTEPHVVLTDIRMPPDRTDEGIRAAQLLKQTHPDIGVIALSQYLEPEYALALLGEGSRARGYILKDRVDDVAAVVQAIQTVAAGGSFIDDRVIDSLVAARSRAAGNTIDTLTARERETLREMATGKSNGAIAATLYVSEHAVEKHTNSIFTKLGLLPDVDVNRRVAAVLLYLSGRHGDA